MVQELEVISETQLTNARVRLLSGDIFHIKWNDAMDIEISDIDELGEVFHQIPEGKKVCVIQEMGDFTSISGEARKYAAQKSPEIHAIAYVIKGLGQRMILRFYLNMKKTKTPAKVFTCMVESVQWLKKFKKTN
jgi:hypothetical protein